MPSLGGPDSRWSQTHTESRPTASACRPKVRTCGQVGTWPGPSDTAMGTTTPIRMPASLGRGSWLLPKTYACAHRLGRGGGLLLCCDGLGPGSWLAVLWSFDGLQGA